MIWNYGKDKPLYLINLTNNCNPNIKFTYELLDSEMDFLDVKLILAYSGLKTT